MLDGFRGFGELRKRLDSKGMFDLVRAFPSHMVDGWDHGKRFSASLGERKVGQVVVCGMGGSAIGADMVRSFLGDALAVPLHVNRLYEVPAALRRDAFFVFSSYSGDTAETLAAYDAVRVAHPPSAAITTGGELERRCKRDGVSVCVIPGGMPPRAAIAYSFFPLLLILRALGLAEVDEAEFGEAVAALEGRCEDYASDSAANEAAELARRLEGKIPFIYSRGRLFDAVARRWSCQFNENSKTPAHFAAFTEINHNEIVGWKAVELVRKRIVVISLEDEEDHPSSKRQADIALEIIDPLSGGVVRVDNAPGKRLSRILSMMILGDFASVYLAYLNGVDPTPISNIEFLKERLRENRG